MSDELHDHWCNCTGQNACGKHDTTECEDCQWAVLWSEAWGRA